MSRKWFRVQCGTLAPVKGMATNRAAQQAPSPSRLKVVRSPFASRQTGKTCHQTMVAMSKPASNTDRTSRAGRLRRAMNSGAASNEALLTNSAAEGELAGEVTLAAQLTVPVGEGQATHDIQQGREGQGDAEKLGEGIDGHDAPQTDGQRKDTKSGQGDGDAGCQVEQGGRVEAAQDEAGEQDESDHKVGLRTAETRRLAETQGMDRRNRDPLAGCTTSHETSPRKGRFAHVLACARGGLYRLWPEGLECCVARGGTDRGVRRGLGSCVNEASGGVLEARSVHAILSGPRMP